MPAKAIAQKSVTDLLADAANTVADAMTAQDANDPQMQQILGQLQQVIVQTIHHLRSNKSAAMAGTPQGQAMSAAPGQPGYGSGSPAQADMVAAMNGQGAGLGGGGLGGDSGVGGAAGIQSPDELSRSLGTVGRG